MAKAAERKPQIVLWDIECTNLNANFGYVLCVGFKRLGEKKPTVISITDFPRFKHDPTNDRDVVKAASAILGAADLWVTWYGARFDVPYLQARLIYHKLPIMPPVQHCDAWRIAKYKLKLNSNRLASVAGFLSIEEKTPLTGPIWTKAAAGHRQSVKYIMGHCAQDVTVLEQAYERIKILAPSPANVALMMDKPRGCSVCGSTRLRSHGWRYTALSKYRRFRCLGCGTYERASRAESRIVI